MALFISHPAAAGTIKCGTSDSSLTTQQNPPFERFYPVRSGVKGVHLIYRDVEFMWDSLYAGGLTDSVRFTLRSLARSLVDSTGKNPFGANFSDFQLIYEYFRRQGSAYTTDPGDTSSVKFGQGTDTYNPSDRSHADCYVFNKAARPVPYGGSYPSGFVTDDEDLTTGHDVGDVKPANALAVSGPLAARKHDLTGAGWTAPDSIFTTGFDHEFQHGLPPGQSPGFSSEMFSACAEAVGGNADTEHIVDEVPYTWSLLAQRTPIGGTAVCGAPSGTCVRSMGSNYQGRSLFAAYLGYNFRGSDTTATLTGMSDDLVWKWVRSGRQVQNLRNLLRDQDCGTCAGKTYFHPGGVPLDTASRMALLHHNWRVANYVNNASLDEGQYGYPPQFGFTPSRQIGAWREVDPYATDDLVAIPPEVTLTSTHRTREMVLKGERSFRGNTYPLVLQPYGSEYWVVRSDPSSWAVGQDLIVRVHPEGIHREESQFFCDLTSITRRDGRLVASVVAYAVPADSVAGARLWAHPEWARRAIPPKWVDVDSLAGALEFVVPSFGDSFTAAVVVLSLADGPSQSYSGSGLSFYIEALHYRLDLGLRRAPFQAENPLAIASSMMATEDFATWSPSGDEVAYGVEVAPMGAIRRRKLSGGPAQTLAMGRFPDWSPRGSLIAFVADTVSGGSRVWLYDTLTAQASQLTFRSGAAVSPVFSPNGRQLAYARSVNDFPLEPSSQGATCATCGWELRRVDVGGTNDTLLLRLFGQFAMRSVRWSPDGQWIYLKKQPTVLGLPGPDELWVVAWNGAQAFTRGGLMDDAWSFDLHRGSGPLLLEQGGSVQWRRTCQDLETGQSDTIWTDIAFLRLALRDTLASDTRARFYRTGAEFYNPRWSPEGTRVAYSSNQNLSSDRDLFVGQVSFNHAPTLLLPAADLLVHTGRPYELYANATDPDGEALTYQVPDLYLPGGASFTPATRRFSWPSPGPVCSENFLVFRALDGSGGVANRVVKITAAIDSIGDLNADVVGDSAVWLTWTAPGDNGTLGRGVEYELRYAQLPLSEGWFVGTRVTGMAAPAVPGSNELQMVEGLSPGTTYYLAIRTKDALGNWSILSNVVQVTTTSGGGGGTFGAQESRTGLMGARAAQPGISQLGGGEGSAAVLSVEMGLNHGAPAWSIRQLGADEVTALGAIDSVSVLLQARAEAGTWFTRARIMLKDAAWRFGVRTPHRPGRIVFIGSYHVRQAWSSVERDGGSGSASLVTAQHSRLGDVESSFDASGSARLDVSSTDTLTLSYEWLAQASEIAQDWFLLVGPPGSEVSTPSRLRPAVSPENPLPSAFALRQNQPNPFSGHTTIRFELPVETPVRLEIFDAQGRLIRTLADGRFPAGYHVVDWDERAAGGRDVGSGVYLYRIQAGTYRAQKKMVLLPR